jgi:hypothetical protein
MSTRQQPPGDAEDQRDALLESQRRAHQGRPRDVKEDALTDKVVTVEPDGTGPTSTRTFDPDTDQALNSGNGGTASKDEPKPRRP